MTRYHVFTTLMVIEAGSPEEAFEQFVRATAEEIIVIVEDQSEGTRWQNTNLPKPEHIHEFPLLFPIREV
jgi:hypothetical protein